MTTPATETLEREKDKLTAGRLRELFDYDAETGIFRRKFGGGGMSAGGDISFPVPN